MEQLQKFLILIKFLSDNEKDLDIVIRPHPSESIKTWEILTKDISNHKILIKKDKKGNIVFKLVDGINFTYQVMNNESYSSSLRRGEHINSPNNELIKNGLLHYYRKNELTNNERVILHEIMLEAFPNGIPLLDRKEISDIKNEVIELGNKLLISTTKESSVPFLDEEIVIVSDIKENGIWVTFGDDNFFLFLNDKNKNIYSGIARYNIVKKIKNNNIKKITQNYTSINHDGNIVKIDVNTNEVIFPENMNNMIYLIHNLIH